MRKEKVCTQSLSCQVDQVVSFLGNHFSPTAELLQEANNDLIYILDQALGQRAQQKLD